MEEKPAIRPISGRNPDGTFPKGVSGNISGRPKGTLKDYVRQKFMAMSVDEKEAFLSGIDEATIWRMGEGNPAQETDITTGGEKIDFSKIDPKQQALLEDFENKLKEGYGAAGS